MKTIKLKLFCLFAIFISTQMLHAQTQVGADIDGEAAGDRSGFSVSMPDANTVAIGAMDNSDAGLYAGHDRVYEWNGSTWIQKGADIDGEASGDRFGNSVSMPDANTVGIGAPLNDGSGFDAGHARVFEWNGSVWVQKGTDIDGEAASDYFGGKVSMPDANTIAIGAIRNSGAGSLAGHVRIYQWSGNAWIQKGIDIDGETSNDNSGIAVSMPDASTVAIGAYGNSSDAGHVRIYGWNGSAWIQKGADIDGEAVGDYSGYSVSMADANTLAVGAPMNDGTGSNAGHVRIYTWNGSAWLQKGADLDGESASDESGTSVDMPDANTVGIGAIHNTGNGFEAGHVRIYKWSGSGWVQKGLDIDGEAFNNQSGQSVSMPDANNVAIGAPANDQTGFRAGHVRVYSLSNVNIVENSFGDGFVLFPNPTSGKQTVNLGSTYADVSVIVRNAIGQETFNKYYVSADKLELNLQDEPGIYFIEITSDNRRAVVKVVKE